MGIPRPDFFDFLFNRGRGIRKNQVDWSVDDHDADAYIDGRIQAAGGVPAGVLVRRRIYDAEAISDLATTRLELLPAPAAGQYVIPHRLIVSKTGGPDPPAEVAGTNIWLATAPVAGGLLNTTVGSPNFLTTGPNRLYRAAAGFQVESGWVRPGDYQTVYLFGGSGGFGPASYANGGMEVFLWTDSPLVLIGYSGADDDAAAQTQWGEATAGLGDLEIVMSLEYTMRNL